ncbi:hypothetical protein [Laceyella putida]|uniref:Uncharacterized protein n=1 Tax=Laceyella putida TaxID=110101 RepID=A0ABW2RMI6_9BACL
MKKMGTTLASLFAVGLMIFAPQSAFADTYFDWDTRTGPEHKITNLSSGADVKVYLVNYWYRQHVSTHDSIATDNSDHLAAKLCNVATGNCTVAKPLDGDAIVYFTDMKAGDYTIVITDDQSSYFYYGEGGYLVY